MIFFIFKSLTKSTELLCSFIKSAQLPCVLLPTSIQINERNHKNEVTRRLLKLITPGVQMERGLLLSGALLGWSSNIGRLWPQWTQWRPSANSLQSRGAFPTSASSMFALLTKCRGDSAPHSCNQFSHTSMIIWYEHLQGFVECHTITSINASRTVGITHITSHHLMEAVQWRNYSTLGPSCVNVRMSGT